MRTFLLGVLLYIVGLMLCVSLLFAQQQEARMSMGVVGGSVPTASPCPAGTYMSAWNGDYTSDTDKACYNSGAANSDGTLNGGALTSAGHVSDAATESLDWTITTQLPNGGVSDTVGTIWVKVKFNGSSNANQTFFGAGCTDSNATNNYFACQLTSGARIQCYYAGGNNGATSQNHTSIATDTVAVDDSPEWVGYTWDLTGGADDGNHCVITGNEAWSTLGVCADELTLTWKNSGAVEVDPDVLFVGHKTIGGNPTSWSVITVEEIYVYTTFKAAHP